MAIVRISGSMIAANSVTNANIKDGAIAAVDLDPNIPIGSGVAPTITSIAYPSGRTAANPAGGETLTITGNNFLSNATVVIEATTVTPATINSTSITITSPAKAAGSYMLVIINGDGGTAINLPGVQYSTLPTFTTAAGSISNTYEYSTFSSSIAGTSDSTITFSLISGTLPSGISLAANGLLTGTLPQSNTATTYTFTVLSLIHI